jgi:hypothetical protein
MLVLAVIVAGSLATTATAGSRKQITLPLHGTIKLANSNVRCGSGQGSGITYIDCGISTAAGQPKPGGYLALMLGSGKVNIIAVSTKKTVFNRSPAGREQRSSAAATYPTVHPGDVISLPGAPAIQCRVSAVSGKTTIICYDVDKNGVVRPGSYSFGMSNVVTTALGWDKGRKVHLINSWAENG